MGGAVDFRTAPKDKSIIFFGGMIMDWWDVHMGTWPGSWTYGQKVNFLHAYKDMVKTGGANTPKYTDKVVDVVLGAENSNIAMKAVGSALSGVNFMYSGAIEANFINMVDYIHQNGFPQLRSGVADGTIPLPNCPGVPLSTNQLIAVAYMIERATFK